ncbi:MAG: FAD-dependent oxidoreductase [Clostridia bacterium]|nr:FAD-dependent oxidoreductase [Clostridia bacterium]
MYDIIIIGAGPAGLTAALYARRAGKTVLIIEKSTFGGQMTFSPKIENFPGSAAISGNALADQMVSQVLEHGAEVELDEVVGIEDRGATKFVKTTSGGFETKTVIIAVGVKHRKTGAEGEEKFLGDGISFCAVCDGDFYAGKEVAVIGGGNSALQEAILLSEKCTKVTMVQNLPYFTGEAKTLEVLKGRPNVEFITDAVVKSFNGDDAIRSVTLSHGDGNESTLNIDGVFVAIGLIPSNKAFENVCGLDTYGYADSGEDCRTKTAGVFVAGDCRSKKIRQITTAAADGSVAALAACNYIDMM